jgi:hypothetical protein
MKNKTKIKKKNLNDPEYLRQLALEKLHAKTMKERLDRWAKYEAEKPKQKVTSPEYPRGMLSQVCWFMSAGGGG